MIIQLILLLFIIVCNNVYSQAKALTEIQYIRNCYNEVNKKAKLIKATKYEMVSDKE